MWKTNLKLGTLVKTDEGLRLLVLEGPTPIRPLGYGIRMEIRNGPRKGDIVSWLQTSPDHFVRSHIKNSRRSSHILLTLENEFFHRKTS